MKEASEGDGLRESGSTLVLCFQEEVEAAHPDHDVSGDRSGP